MEVQLSKEATSVSRKRSKNKWCEVCSMELKTAIHAQKHYLSANHIRNMEQLCKKTFCPICSFYIAGDMTTNGHLNTKKHIRNSEAYCKICKKTMSKDALQEHENSFSHLRASSCIDKGGLPAQQLNHGSSVCCEPAERKSARLRSTLTNPNIHCEICDKKFLLTKFYSHLSKFPHCAVELIKSQGASDIFSVINGDYIICHLCHAKMATLAAFEGHFSGKRHQKELNRQKSKTAYNTEKVTPNDVKDVTNHSRIIVQSVELSNNDVPRDMMLKENDWEVKNQKTHNISHTQDNKILKEINGIGKISKEVDREKREPFEVKNNVENNEPSSSSNIFFCYLCKLEFKNKIELNVHAIRFPHIEMAKWKSEVVSLGVSYAEYWVHSDGTLTCTICSTEVSNAHQSRKHMNEANHKSYLAEWCKEFASWKFGNIVHPKYFHCKSCNLRLSGTTEAERHYDGNIHLKRLEWYCETCKVSSSSEEMFLDHRSSKEHTDAISNGTRYQVDERHDQQINTFDSPRMEVQESQEVQKLLNNLRTLKIGPPNVTLEYPKKEELKDIHEKNGGNSSRINASNSSGSTIEYKLESVMANKSTKDEIPTVTVEETHTGTKGRTKDESKILLESEIGNSNTGFLRMFLEIVELRRMAKSDIERAVLDEMGSLFYGIVTSEAPLKDILEILKYFNWALDLKLLKFSDQ